MPPGTPYCEALFIAHESKEIFGAAAIGMNVAAFNYQAEDDAQEIEVGIASRNERFIIEKGKKPWICSVEGFGQISCLASLGHQRG